MLEDIKQSLVQRHLGLKFSSVPPSKDKYLATEIWKYFGKKMSFPMLMYFIKSCGWQAIYEIFQEVKRVPARDAIALFMWKVGEEKKRIIWQKE